MATRPKSTAAAPASTHYWLVNTGRAGVTYDADGHQVGGGERIIVSSVDHVGQAAIDRGSLRLKAIPRHAEPQPAEEPTA